MGLSGSPKLQRGIQPTQDTHRNGRERPYGQDTGETKYCSPLSTDALADAATSGSEAGAVIEISQGVRARLWALYQGPDERPANPTRCRWRAASGWLPRLHQ